MVFITKRQKLIETEIIAKNLPPLQKSNFLMKFKKSAVTSLMFDHILTIIYQIYRI